MRSLLLSLHSIFHPKHICFVPYPIYGTNDNDAIIYTDTSSDTVMPKTPPPITNAFSVLSTSTDTPSVFLVTLWTSQKIFSSLFSSLCLTCLPFSA